jgi:chromosomal replication initiation ATPase DnaA
MKSKSPYVIAGLKPPKRLEEIDPAIAYLIILEELENIYGTSKETLSLKNRKRDYVYLRHLYFYFMKDIWKDRITLKWLGNTLNRDHATVIHAVNNFKNKLDTDERLPDDFPTKMFTVVNDYYITSLKLKECLQTL